MNSKADNPQWEKAFTGLDKRVFSADLFKGYDLPAILGSLARPDDKILDFGCGKGDMVRQLRSSGYQHTVGADPSESLMKESSGQKEAFLYVMENGMLPFADKSMDVIYVSGVLHHIEWGMLPVSVSEMRRVLKPNGKLIILEPRQSFLRSLGHLVILSPISKAFKNAAALADCLRAEWPTYSVWLKKESEFWTYLQKNGFKPVQMQRKIMTVIGVFVLEH